MKDGPSGLVIGISIGLVIGALSALFGLLCFRFHRKQPQVGTSSSRRAASVPFRTNGVDTSTILSDSSAGTESSRTSIQNGISFWLGGMKKAHVVAVSGILEYSYKDLQKATYNFTSLIGQGAFGPVYKAQMITGEAVAVKVLATDSKQGEKEFQTEVMLLGRLHHRNLVNLVGYCAERGQHMLIYVYMSKGSLFSHLYGETSELLSWDLRVQVALDVARGLEYLHDGAVPPVIHRDIKSSNILLDRSMRARVADFGLSREDMINRNGSNIQGTFGYLDPEYISTRAFTKKSDVYSFGVLLFELIAGRNPQQGLMEYVELAAMNTEGKVGWEEIVDSRLDGNFDEQELNEVAALAYKCVNRSPKQRPSMRDIVQVLSRILGTRHSKRHHKSGSSADADGVSVNVDRQSQVGINVDQPDFQNQVGINVDQLDRQSQVGIDDRETQAGINVDQLDRENQVGINVDQLDLESQAGINVDQLNRESQVGINVDQLDHESQVGINVDQLEHQSLVGINGDELDGQSPMNCGHRKVEFMDNKASQCEV